jgi:hypothetical protein
LGVDIGADTGIDMGSGGSERNRFWRWGWDLFKREAWVGGRWLWELLKGEVWLVGWVGTDTGEYFAGMEGLDVLCCIHGIDFREYMLVLA